jgi:uncharacterized RDD family membrane protein YckC
VSSNNDDYYELIGVQPGAATDEIRKQYRTRRDELAAQDTDTARTEAAQLNRAWNVLSDPYQRGRYDAQREAAGSNGATDDVEVVDDADEERVTLPRRRSKLFDTGGPARNGKQPPRAQPTITPPPGMHFAETRPRLLAMAVDILLLFVIFLLGVYVVGAKYMDNHFPKEVDQLNALHDQRDAAVRVGNDLSDASKKANDHLTTLQKENASHAAIASATAASKAADAKVTAQEKKISAIDDRIRHVQSKLTPTQLTILEIVFFICLLYLAIPSALTGQTVGKRIFHVKVLRANGQPLGWSGAFVRYGVIILAMNLLSLPLQYLAGVLVIVVILGWIRNPNRQGMHDRLAKTIVVAV